MARLASASNEGRRKSSKSTALTRWTARTRLSFVIACWVSAANGLRNVHGFHPGSWAVGQPRLARQTSRNAAWQRVWSSAGRGGDKARHAVHGGCHQYSGQWCLRSAACYLWSKGPKPTTENNLRWPEIDGRPRGEESDRAVLTDLATNQSESEATTECGNETKGPSAIDSRPCICLVFDAICRFFGRAKDKSVNFHELSSQLQTESNVLRTYLSHTADRDRVHVPRPLSAENRGVPYSQSGPCRN